MEKKYLAFDIEIATVIRKEWADWREGAPLGITCASTLATGDAEAQLWFHGMGDEIWRESDIHRSNPIEGAMTPDELEELIHYLSWMTLIDYNLLTWNGLKFDLPVLAEEMPDWLRIPKMAWGHVDMMFHFFCLKNYFLGLNNAAKGLGLAGKTEGMSGAYAPLLWMDEIPPELVEEFEIPDELLRMPPLDRRRKILEYVGQDAHATMDVCVRAETKGGVGWTSKGGKHQWVKLNGGWLPVCEAVNLDQPDVSWMDNPLSRKVFYEWLDGKT